MKTLTAILIVLALNNHAQQSDNWLTPFATVEFKDGKIMYYYAGSDVLFRLTPVFIPGNLVIISDHMRIVEPETFQHWKETIRGMVSAAGYPAENTEENLKFIQAFTLQTIWSMGLRDPLPPQQAYETILMLTENSDKTVAENAKLARGLFELAQKYYQSKNQ